MTTITISNELKRRIKILSVNKDLKYEEFLNEVIDVYEEKTVFHSEKEFEAWFKNNFHIFGFTKITRGVSPDYVVETLDGKTIRVELELTDSRYNHKMGYCDLIICAYSNKKMINNVPIIALNWGDKIIPNKIVIPPAVQISISFREGEETDLWDKLKKEFPGTDKSLILKALKNLDMYGEGK